jgi:hypothetical protein
MRPTAFSPVLFALLALLVPGAASAQSVPPVIHRATLQPDTGVLTIAGTGLGADLVVSVDGQAVEVLPGASATQLEVLVPATVATMAGTFRLTVVDPARRVGDGFIVASTAASSLATVSPVVLGDVLATSAPTRIQDTMAVPRAARTPASAAVSPNLVETGITAVGVNALGSNTTGTTNTAAGRDALEFNTTGSNNTATGNRALEANNGDDNTATGSFALAGNTSGDFNTAIGVGAMRLHETGFGNTAVGGQALFNNVTSSHNTAVGWDALVETTGPSNTAVGYRAGFAATTGDYNVFIGADVVGTASDTNTIRIGLPFSGGVGQNATFIAGIRDTTVTGELVLINSSGQLGSASLTPNNSVGSAQVVSNSLDATDLAPDAVGTSELAADAVTALKVAFNYAGSASEGGPASDVACAACVSASEVGFTFATLGSNTFAGTQAIGAGNLDLAPSSATEGNLTKNGVRFLHNAGTRNTFLGASAGNFTLTGSDNSAIGNGALTLNTTGASNTAHGAQALVRNTSGTGNTGVGSSALDSTTTGVRNTALGMNAGANTTTGSHNVFVGADVTGTAADTNTIRIGLPYNGSAGQNQTFIAGIAGTQLTAPAVQVYVDANGQLGTLTPPIASGGGTVGPQAGPPSALEQQVQAQQATIAEMQTLVADLRARLARLEAAGTRRR